MILGIELVLLVLTLVLRLKEDEVDVGCRKNDPGGNIPGVRRGAEALAVAVEEVVLVE